MNRSDLTRCALATVPVAFLLAFTLAPLTGVAWSLCFGLTAVWAGANLWALGWLMEALALRKDVKSAAIALQVKLAILLIGVLTLVNLPIFSFPAFVAGFHVIFAVIAVRLVAGGLRARTPREAA